YVLYKCLKHTDNAAVTTILVTGFEPYGGLTFNPTERIINVLALSGDPDLVTALLPTSYLRAEADLIDLLRAHLPSAVLMLGLKQHSSGLCVENVALNMDSSVAPDNDGEIRLRKRIIKGAPDNYPNTLSLDLMANISIDMGEPVDFSHDAGGYVCNHAFFVAAHVIAKELDNCSCGFIHVPPIQESSERMMRVIDIVQNWIKLLKAEA
ncbi:MAG: hypothetical protein ACR2QW_00655, partial [bacterium]